MEILIRIISIDDEHVVSSPIYQGVSSAIAALYCLSNHLLPFLPEEILLVKEASAFVELSVIH